MIVVADTSPLNYLILIDCDNLLPQLYGHIVVPMAVMRELGHSGAPSAVEAWLTRVPAWINVTPVRSVPDAELAFLGLGEQEAIQLAEEHHATLLLIDERKGRLEAKRRGLRTTGTLGVLLSAGDLRLIDAEAAYRRLLVETSFRTSAALEAQFLGQIGSEL
jgi:predicted nucleic acid-binding protein